MTFNIKAPNEQIRAAVIDKIDNLNKPKGSLGMLEKLALQICLVQQTLNPSLNRPCHLLLGGDHGIEHEGVSVSPRDVTWQQMINFTRGGGGVNMFCRQHGFQLRIVDVGVDHDLSAIPAIIDRKIAYGTRNFLREPAMTIEQYQQAISIGASLVDDCADEGSNIICIGEMGIANTSPSSIWMHLLGNIPLDECIGTGAGLDEVGLQHKRNVLHQSVNNYLSILSPLRFESEQARTLASDPSPLVYFGGFEMITAIGAMLRAAELKMLIMVDGFIMSACALAACRLEPQVRHYMIFGHCGDESGHKKMLQLMNAEPLLHLGMRLGEGTGALCCYPIIQSAVNMMNEMNNFKKANITKYF